MKQTLALLLCLLLCACGAPEREGLSLPVSSVPEALPFVAEEEPETAEPAPSYVESLAADLARELGLYELEDEARVRAVYHYMVENVYFADPVGLDVWRYVQGGDAPIPYLENRSLSPFLFRIGSCEDFAAATVMLLRAAGFEAEYVAGFTLSVDGVYIDHAWTLVKLDGVWYHLDTQLEQNVTKGNLLTYRYYLKSDEDMHTDHKWGENLIDYWNGMPQGEKDAIRALYTPPACPESFPTPAPVSVPLPGRPNLAGVEAEIARLKGLGPATELPPMRLNVEPPVLVRQHHITPPLLYHDDKPAQPLRYGRSFLEEEDAQLYDALLEAAESMQQGARISVSPSMSNIQAVWVADTLLGDYPELFWAAFSLEDREDGRWMLFVCKDGDPEKAAAQQAALEEEAARLLAGTEGMDEVELLRYLHDYMAGELEYDRLMEGRDSANPYGALVEHSAYCDGFARGFQYLAMQAGLDVVYIKGTSTRGIPHAWNAVRLDEGWYYVDVTWARPLHPYDEVYHDYFLISREEMDRQHFPDAQQYPSLPPSGTEQPGYYELVGYAVKDGEDPVEALAEVFYRQLTARGAYPAEEEAVFLECKVVGDEESYLRWKEDFVRELFRILQCMEEKARGENAPFTIAYDTSVQCDFNDVMQVFTFYPKVSRLEEGY